MESFIYLLKASAGMVALYTLYWLLLRKHTYFAFNRFYLLTAVLVALAAPFVVLTETAPEALPITEITIEPIAVVSQPTPEPFMTTEQVLLLVYMLGVIVMLGRLGFRLWQVVQIIRAGERQRAGKYILVRAADESISSFSFLNYLVVSQKDTESYGDVVLRHELVHIHQRHSWDLLWLELIHLFWWFNPILIFYKRSLKEVHEFIADELATNGDRLEYAHTLVGYAFGVSPNVLTNSFFDATQLKNRIAMLTKNRSSRWVLGRYLLAVPVVGILVSFVAARTVEVIEQQPEMIVETSGSSMIVKGKIVDKKDKKPLPGVEVSINGVELGTTTDSKGDFVLAGVPIKSELLVSFIGFKTKIIPLTGKDKSTHFVKIELEQGQTLPLSASASNKATTPPKTIIVDGEEVMQVVDTHPQFPGGLAAMGNYLSKNIKYPEAARRANVEGKVFVSFVVRKDGSISNVEVIKGLGFGCDEEAVRVTEAMPRWKPGMDKGAIVNVKFNLPIRFELGKKTANKTGSVDIKKAADFTTPLQGNSIGVAQKSGESKYRFNLRGTSKTGVEPLVVLDGVAMTNGMEELKEDNRLNPDDISSISILKTETARSIYGAKAENGVIIITTRAYAKAQKSIENVSVKYRTPLTLFEINGVDPKLPPYYVLDGKEIADEKVKTIDPNSIQSVHVLKGEDATQKYGDKGKNGVVEITTKK
ncbi:TonB family protein [Runella sp.]|uniref:TonB family protein n=1 Tax=Runella sp. TaxID=1960881 RepID=UPI003D13C5EC